MSLQRVSEAARGATEALRGLSIGAGGASSNSDRAQADAIKRQLRPETVEALKTALGLNR